MLNLEFAVKKESSLNILCLGAHGDDIEIGCGGTILRLLSEYKNAHVTWVVFSGAGQRIKESRKAAGLFLDSAKKKKVVIKDFRDGYFPYQGKLMKQYFETLKNLVDPHVIFTHYRQDLHQDHRLISELTWNTFRDHLIVEYEIVKYDGDLGRPNLFVQLDEDVCRRKVEYLTGTFQSQQGHHWFAEDTFRAMLRLRGVESNAPAKYAEGFYCRKIVY